MWVNGGTNSLLQLITHHSLAHGPHVHHSWPFFPNPPRPSLLLQSLCTFCFLYLELFSLSLAQLTHTCPSNLSSKVTFSEGFATFWTQFKPMFYATTTSLCILSHGNIALGMICLATVCPDWAMSSMWVDMVFLIPCFFPSPSWQKAHIHSTNTKFAESTRRCSIENKRDHNLSGDYIKQLETHNEKGVFCGMCAICRISS